MPIDRTLGIAYDSPIAPTQPAAAGRGKETEMSHNYNPHLIAKFETISNIKVGNKWVGVQ